MRWRGIRAILPTSIARWSPPASRSASWRAGRHGWIVLLAVIALAFAWHRALKNPAIKLRWHTWLLTAPLYGRFERSLNTSRFASTLAITTGSGVPILRALQTSRDTLTNA